MFLSSFASLRVISEENSSFSFWIWILLESEIVLFSAVQIHPYSNLLWDKRASPSDNPYSDATWESFNLPQRRFSVGFWIILKVEVWLELWIWIWIRETFLSEITRWVTIQTFCGFTDIVLTYFKSTFFFGFSIGTRFMVSSRHVGSDCMELYIMKSKGCEVRNI